MTPRRAGAFHWLVSLLRNLVRGRSADADLDAEVRSYVDLLTDEKIAQGLRPAAARRAALIEAGGIESAKEQTRTVRAGAWLGAVGRDVRYAIRVARRQPGFTLAAVLTLALGIGANTAVFSVVNAVLLRDLPYAEPDRVVRFQNRDAADTFGVSERERLIYAAESSIFAEFATYYFAAASLTGGGEAERLSAAVVDPNLFAVLGVRPARGRLLEAADAAGGPGTVVVLTDGFWTRRFGRDERAVGETIVLNDRPRTIVGVLPPGVDVPGAFTERTVEVYLPQVFTGPPDPENIHYLEAIARPAPGLTLDEARAAVAVRAAEVGDQITTLPPDYGVSLIPVPEVVLGDVRPGLIAVTAGVGLLLLIACGNLASLLLARAEQRTSELGLRAALGAGRSRLVRQMLTESLVLAGLGGALGIGLAYAGTRALVALDPSLPRLGEVAVDGAALAFTVGLSVVTGLLFGLLPAWSLSRRGLHALAAGTGRNGGDGRFRGRRPLVAGQVALAVTLAIGAGLLGRTIGALAAVPAGFDPEGVLTLRITLPSRVYPDLASGRRYLDAALAELRALPGVTAAGATTHLPLVNGTGDWGLLIEGMPERLDNGRRPDADWMAVSEGYFAAMGIPVLEGRGYLASDADGTRPVTIVNARVAREYFAGRSALGGRMQMSSTIDPIYREIVGIVADVHHDGLDTEPARQMFLPLSQFPTGRADAQIGSVSLVVRTDGDPSALIGPVRARLAELDPEVPVALVSPMDDLVTRSTSTSRLYLILFTLFSGLALVIVSVGVYGVASYLVATRRRELAIRRALGATAGSIVRLVLGEGAALAAVGVGAGVVGALAFGSLLESLLFGVTTRDLLTFVAVPVSVAIVTVLANLLPARTALRENAVHALRLE